MSNPTSIFSLIFLAINSFVLAKLNDSLVDEIISIER